jgi:hypothetical protein
VQGVSLAITTALRHIKRQHLYWVLDPTDTLESMVDSRVDSMVDSMVEKMTTASQRKSSNVWI